MHLYVSISIALFSEVFNYIKTICFYTDYDTECAEIFKQYLETIKNWKPCEQVLNHQAFKQLLQHHPDHDTVAEFVDWCKNGVNIHFEGDDDKLLNYPRSYVPDFERLKLLLQIFIDQGKTGWFMPTKRRPKFIASISVVPKPGEFREGLDAWRLISNFSKNDKKRGKYSVNEGIPKEFASVSGLPH